MKQNNINENYFSLSIQGDIFFYIYLYRGRDMHILALKYHLVLNSVCKVPGSSLSARLTFYTSIHGAHLCI